MFVSIPDCFMISFCMGLIFGAVYEVLRIIRILLPFKAIIFICDIIFFIVSANAVMSLSEFLGSYIRIYTIIGYGAGIFTYIVTIGRLLNAAENVASKVWRRSLKKIGTVLGNLISNPFREIAHKIKSIIVKNAEYLTDNQKNADMLLKFHNEMMYNEKRLEKNGGKANVIKASVRKDIRSS